MRNISLSETDEILLILRSLHFLWWCDLSEHTVLLPTCFHFPPSHTNQIRIGMGNRPGLRRPDMVQVGP